MKRIGTALICLLVACCGGAALAQSAPTDSESPPSVAKFALSYVRSGGLRPNPQSLRVEPGRHATAERSKVSAHGGSMRSTQFRIGVEQVKRLRAELERANFTAIRPPRPETAVCTDCFLYEIRYRGRTVNFNTVTLPRRLRPVVERVEAVIEAHLPFH